MRRALLALIVLALVAVAFVAGGYAAAKSYQFTGTVKANIPVASFAKNDKGLVISMSKTEIDAAAKPAAANKTTTTTTKTTKKPK